MLDCQIWGLRAGGHHLTNVLLHAAAAILLFLALRQMTGALWRSAFVAALFAIHPQRVESVAWIAERKDVLSGVFFMLTILAYVRYARKPSSRRELCAGRGSVRARADVQRDAGDAAICAPASGLLAAAAAQPGDARIDSAARKSRARVALGRREDSAFRALGGVVRDDKSVAGEDRAGPANVPPVADRERHRFLCHLCETNALARGVGASLFQSTGRFSALAGWPRAGALDRSFDRRVGLLEDTSLPDRGLALVSGNDGARHRAGANLLLHARGSLHLFAADWPLPDGGLGRR